VESNLKILRDRSDNLDKKITQNNQQQEKLLKNVGDLSRTVGKGESTIDPKQSLDLQATLNIVIDGMKDIKRDMESIKKEVTKLGGKL